MENVKEALESGFITYVVPLLFSGLALLGGWALKKLSDKLGTQTNAGKLELIGARLASFARTIVLDLEATMRPELGRAAADGKLSSSEKATLRDAALRRFRELLGEKGMAEVAAVLGIAAPGVGDVLLGHLEKAVLEMKGVKAQTQALSAPTSAAPAVVAPASP